MVGGQADTETYVLTIEAVRASIDLLQEQHIHPFFPAYLHLRQQGVKYEEEGFITPNWSELGELLEVPGGPAGRPYFRPFWTQRREAGQEWLNRNLAGSYAPSSIRNVPRKVIRLNSDGTFGLLPNHWVLARKHLADDRKIPVVALAGFFLRNYGFRATDPPELRDLIEEFARTFRYDQDIHDDEFHHLYTATWSRPDIAWFEIWQSPEAPEEQVAT